MKVSVVVATYRRDETLKNALRSIIEQTYENIEIIVVDDNADKDWNDRVNKIIKGMGNIKSIKYVLNKQNKGSAQTRNSGIEISSGDYVTFLDDDDIYLPNKIKKQLEHMKEMKSDFSVTDLELLNENGKRIEKRTREYIKSNNIDELFKNHLMHHITGTDTMMFRREYLLKIGGFEPINVGDEFYLMQKAIEGGGTFSYLPVCDIKAYVHSSTEGLSSGDGKINGENALYEYKKKYFNRLDKKTIRYIKMRHYAVLAFAEIRRKRYVDFIKYSIKSMISSPMGCINLLCNL